MNRIRIKGLFLLFFFLSSSISLAPLLLNYKVFTEDEDLIEKDISVFNSVAAMDASPLKNGGGWFVPAFYEEGIYFNYYRGISSEVAFGKDEINYIIQNNDENRAVLSVKLENCNDVQPIGEEPLNQITNYYFGKDPANWKTNIPNFAKVRYQNLYDGIDLVFYSSEGSLKYEFIVAAGADVTQIYLVYDGIESLETDLSGTTLIAKTIAGEMRDVGLIAYQEDQQCGISYIPIQFLINENSITFNVSEYNDNLELIIDPLIYSTYFGAAGIDYGTSMKIDDNDTYYFTGHTKSFSFWGDVAVVKFNPSGPIYTTLLGGTLGDHSYGLALDPYGCVYVTGHTTSDNYPTTVGAFNETFGGGGTQGDVFITRLDENGNLNYSTLLGGNTDDYARSIALDENNSVYITGVAQTSFETTPGAYDQSHNGDYDAFVAKLNANLSNLIYSTYIGGSGRDDAYSIDLDSNGSVYITGHTTSSGFPRTNTTPYGGGILYGDAFVTKLNPSGSNITFSSFIGDAQDEEGRCIKVDDSGNMFIGGYSESPNFPTTSDAYDRTHNDNWDCVFIILNASGFVKYSTFIGGSNKDYLETIAVESNNSFILGSSTYSTDFPTTIDAYNRTHSNAENDWALLKLNLTAGLIYSTYFGGNWSDSFNEAHLDAEGNIHCVGASKSTNFPTTPDAYNQTSNGNWDPIIMKFLNFPTLTDVNFTSTIELGAEQNVSLILEHLSPLSSCLIEVEGSNQSLHQNSYWELYYNWTPSVVGSISCRVFFNDTSGRWNATRINFTVEDTTAPNLISPIVRADPVELGELQWINVTISDFSNITIPPLIEIDGENQTMQLLQNNTWSFNWIPVQVSMINWIIHVNDTWSNCNQTGGSFWVNDTIAPVVINVNYQNTTQVNVMQTILINLTDYSGISKCFVEIGGVNNTMLNNTPTTFFYNWTPISSGEFHYWIYFNDSQGNWDRVIIDITVSSISNGGDGFLLWLVLIGAIVGVVGTAIVLRARRKVEIVPSSLTASVSTGFMKEMKSGGLTERELDSILSRLFKDLMGKSDVDIQKLALKYGVKFQLLERIIVHQIYKGNINGFLESNYLYIE